jgi:hypothetical protein
MSCQRQLLETVGVELSHGHSQQVSRSTGHDSVHVRGPAGAQKLAEFADSYVQHLDSAPRGTGTPKSFDQTIRWNDFARMDQQCGEKYSVPWAAECERDISVSDLQRAEDAEFHVITSHCTDQHA